MRSRPLLWILGAFGALLLLGGPALARTQSRSTIGNPPNVEVLTPSQGQDVPSGSDIAFAGSAYASSGISGVQLIVRNDESGDYWNADEARWQERFSMSAADLVLVDVQQVAWSGVLPADHATTGTYTVLAWARAKPDRNGQWPLIPISVIGNASASFTVVDPPTPPPSIPTTTTTEPTTTTTEPTTTTTEPTTTTTEPTTTTTEPTTTTTEPTTTTTTPGEPQPIGVPGAWDLVFADEFSGNRIDTAKWEPGWFDDSGFSPPVNNNESGCYHPDQVSVANGQLELKAIAISNVECRLKDGSPSDYVSGLINTRKTFNFSYGYSEARMWLPGSDGDLHNWPAFWHTGQDWPRTGEIDVMEGLSSRQPCFSYHWGSRADHRHINGCVDWDDPSGWHTFAVHWEPGRVTYYYDGLEVGSFTEAIVGDPHYLIVNHGLRDTWGIEAPSSVFVDYVRVWQER